MKTMEAAHATRLTSGRLLARNTLWTIAGNIASIVIALFSVPILLKYLGTDRFGIISLVWIVEGQFGLFDLGLSQALTKLVAEKLGSSEEKDIPPIFWGSLLLMAIFGIIGAVVLRAISPWLVYSALRVPTTIQSETLTAFHLVAISLPIVISSAGLRGLLSAHQRFDLLSMARVPVSLFSYLAPLLVLPFSRSLGPFIAVLVLSRFAAWITHLCLCFWVSPTLRRSITIRGAPFRHMLGFGGWMTVTNIVSPFMVNADRFLIGAIISMSAVAYYATPYEVASKLLIIPSAIAGVLFPAFSTALVQDRRRAALLFERGVKYIFLSLFPIIVGVLVWGRPGLGVWLGTAFAQKSGTVLQLLAIGIFANSLAQVPFWQIQAANRPDLCAKVHLTELPCYLFLFWTLTRSYGIEGAGVAWMLRAIIDAVIMFWLSSRLLAESKAFTLHLIKAAILAALVFLASVSIRNITIGVTFTFLVCVVFLLVAWSRYLTPKERELMKNPALLVPAFRSGRNSVEVSS